MRTVLLTAAGTLCLVFAAHAAEAPRLHPVRDKAAATAAPQAPGDRCLESGASLSRAAYRPDDDAACCAGLRHCSQFLSTQTLVQAPSQGHT